jgi:hypothetical protein
MGVFLNPFARCSKKKLRRRGHERRAAVDV